MLQPPTDTPRTDYQSFPIEDTEVVDAYFARQLERELNAANIKIEELLKQIKRALNTTGDKI